MSDTALEPILDAVAVALATINGTGSFESTVRVVNEEPVNHGTQITGMTPALDVFAQRLEQNEGQQGTPRAAFGFEIRAATLAIVGAVTLESRLVAGVTRKQQPHKAWLPLSRDVERIIRANRTWGGTALRTTMQEVTPEYGDDEVMFTQLIRVEYKVSRA